MGVGVGVKDDMAESVGLARERGAKQVSPSVPDGTLLRNLGGVVSYDAGSSRL